MPVSTLAISQTPGVRLTSVVESPELANPPLMRILVLRKILFHIGGKVIACAAFVMLKLCSTGVAGEKFASPSCDTRKVQTPVDIVVTPLLPGGRRGKMPVSVVATTQTSGVRLISVVGSPELAKPPLKIILRTLKTLSPIGGNVIVCDAAKADVALTSKIGRESTASERRKR